MSESIKINWLHPKIVDALAIGICHEQGIDPIDRADGSYNWWMFRSTAEEFLKRSLLEQVAPK